MANITYIFKVNGNYIIMGSDELIQTLIDSYKDIPYYVGILQSKDLALWWFSPTSKKTNV